MQTRVHVEGMDDLMSILNSAQRKAVREGKQVVSKGCLNIKREWQDTWSDLERLRIIPPTIGYDLDTVGTTVGGVVGPPLDSPQGALSHVLEEGTINNPAQPGGLPALDREEPRFIAAVEKLALDLMEGRL